MTDISSDGIRRYLLGEATDTEVDAIEAQYFRSETALDRVAAIEDELVEAFLAGELSPQDRDRFERVYLASPMHRRRVDLIRSLGAAARRAPAGSSRRLRPMTSWRGGLAIAAAVLLAVGGVWLMRTRADRPPIPPLVARIPEQTPNRTEPPRRVFAMALSPLAVRGTGEAPRLVIPPDTDLVALNLLADAAPPDAPPPVAAAVRTAGGDEVWQGPAGAPAAGAGPGVLARVEVPADRLRADDYVITLLARTPDGTTLERARYVLRVRDRGQVR